MIAIDPTAVEDEEWTFGGTYLAFMRLAVDLVGLAARSTGASRSCSWGATSSPAARWSAIARRRHADARQGCPVAGTPITATDERPDSPSRLAVERRAAASEPRPARQPPRATRRATSAPRRIFRQGYEFLEWHEAAPGFRAGLNFVSFQDTPSRVICDAHPAAAGWARRTSAATPRRQPEPLRRLLTVYAAGVYLVPPVEGGERFPGAGAFGL